MNPFKKLFIMRKKVVRPIFKRSCYEQSHPFFISLQLIKLHEIYQNEVAKFMHNYFHRSVPYSVSDIFTFSHDIHQHETRQTSHTRPLSSFTVISSNSLLFYMDINTSHHVWFFACTHLLFILIYMLLFADALIHNMSVIHHCAS